MKTSGAPERSRHHKEVAQGQPAPRNSSHPNDGAKFNVDAPNNQDDAAKKAFRAIGVWCSSCQGCSKIIELNRGNAILNKGGLPIQ